MLVAAMIAALGSMVFCPMAPALAAAPTVLRDAEIENDIRTLATPVWRAAGLEPSTVGIYLVQDPQLNSFVAGGEAIFIHTGLILRAETPNQLIGVIAHESGHITGGHVLRAKEAMRNASIENIIAMVLGAAVSVAGRNPAPMLGAAGVGERAFLQFSIGQEATADHAALNFLDRACQSARGLLKFFEILQQRGDAFRRYQPRPLGPHPSADRSTGRICPRPCEQRALFKRVDSPQSVELLKLIKAKLRAYIDPPSSTLAAYPESDNSVPARYARAMAYYKIPNLDKALPAIDGLIKDFPNNPYYRELKGQMLFENGRVRDAVRPYEDAVRLASGSALLRIELSQVYIETGDAALNKRAIAYLNDASRDEGRDSQVWHFLAVAYGRDNQFGMAALSLAEEALANGKKRDAMQQSQRAKQLLARNSVAYSRAEDINREAEHIDNN